VFQVKRATTPRPSAVEQLALEFPRAILPRRWHRHVLDTANMAHNETAKPAFNPAALLYHENRGHPQVSSG